MTEADVQVLDFIAKKLLTGRFVAFLGAGANLVGRPAIDNWNPSSGFLPKSSELEAHLSTELFPLPPDVRGLSQSAQYLLLRSGSGSLFDTLTTVFSTHFAISPVHRLLVDIDSQLCAAGRSRLVAVTTNYDDALERALREAKVAFDTLAYVAFGEHRGRFVHWPHDESPPEVVETPRDYRRIDPAKRPVVVKIHGEIHRGEDTYNSFVITEDDYIDYLTRSDPATLIPAPILKALRDSHILFLGYSLQDWNLRVIFQRLWGDRRLTYQSYAVLLSVSQLEDLYWNHPDRAVQILRMDLEEFVKEIRDRIGAVTTEAASDEPTKP